MAGYDFEFYETGTMSVTAGQKAFTGTGTAWKIRGCEGALVIVSGAGAVNFVSTLSTDAAGEFRTAWTGPTLANAQYTMWLPSAVAATALSNHQRLAEIIASIQNAQPENANLTALAGLGGDAETLVRFLANGSFDLVKTSDIGIQDPKGTLAKFAALTLAARQLFQTDENGALKAVALASNKALATDENKDVQQIDLGTLGRALLALAVGTNAQYMQGDGTLQAKTGLPVSTATQTALNAKANLTGANFTGDVNTTGSMNPKNGLSTGGIGQGKIYFYNNGNAYVGEIGVSVNTGFGNSIGFYNNVAGNWAFNNSMSVSGSITGGSKSFEIDHPTDIYNKDLVFMSTEAPMAGVEFWGTVRLIDGVAEVDLDAASNLSPGTFAALTQRAIPLRPNNLDGNADVRAGHIIDGKFTIYANDPTCSDEVSWHVKAERGDSFIKSHPRCDPQTGLLIPEHEKEDV
ncbi:hypothetical protein [Brucella rhizosphaerae]|uniref:hypothetical protein n=1 Tax=Brucella rhizosphaerae TaxID=571254 RepID=UPI0011602E01|nr:hypothetical protein [Brucella rhizosphaerae]